MISYGALVAYSLQGWAEQGSTGRRWSKCNLSPKKFSPENPIMSLQRRQGDEGHFVLSNGTTECLRVMMGSLFILLAFTHWSHHCHTSLFTAHAVFKERD